jgi:putative spermidine/putrescine transport system substrate-binding protein
MLHRVRRTALVALIPLLAGLTACGSTEEPAGPAGSLTVDNVYQGMDGAALAYFSAGSSGEFNAALQETFMAGFKKKTGATFTVQAGDCGITKLAGEVNANNVSADLWQFCTPSDYQQAIDKGLLQKIDTTVVPVDQLKDGSYTEYGLDAFQFAVGLLYNTTTFPEGKAPTKSTDIFDTTKFPGKRCISNYPQYQGAVEAAMLNSGKGADQVYPLDMNTVFAQLNPIKADISFYSSAAQGFQDMLNGKCSMGLFPNGSAYKIVKDNPKAPLAYAMRQAVATSSPVGIPRNAKNPKAAQALLRFYITDSASQTAFINETSYLPAVLKQAPEIPAEAKRFALAGDNLTSVVQQDDDWWAANVDSVLKEWNKWLAK